MNTVFTRPFRPRELTPSTIAAFPLPAMAQQLMSEEVFTHAGRNALTLARSEDLTVVLTVVKAGTTIHEHPAPGPATIVLLSGHIVFATDTEQYPLEPGASVVFAADVVHRVEATEDSAFLIVIGGKV